MVNSMNQGSGARGSHQLVSEQSDPALDPAWNDDGEWRSSGQGSQHGPPADRLVSVREMRLQAFEVFRRRSSSYDGSGGGSPEGRIAAIETTMGIWSGTILDLSRKVDRVLDLPDRFDRMEKLLEELVNSKKNAENVIPNPPLPFNVPTLESNHHVPGNGSQNWGSNSPMINSAMSTNEQTPEERIRLLRAIAQKYRVPKESSSFDYPPTVVHMKEVDARPIRAMKFYDSLVVGVAVQSKVISDLPKLVGNLKSLAKSNPSGGVDTVKHEVGNQSSDIDAAVQKVVSHDVASSELSLSDLLSLQEVNMSVGSLALFAGGMVHKSDSLVVYTIEEFGGPNIAVVGELREKIPAISAVQIFFYIYKLTNSSFSINDNSSQSFIFSDSSSQASVMIWDPGKVQASSSGRPLSKSVIEINSEAEALVRARQDMREAMGKLGLSFLKLGNFEIKEAIYDSQRTRAADFKRLATDVDRASRSYRELNAQSVKHLDILHQYLGMMLDVHSAFSNRPSTLLTVQTLISDLSSLHTVDEGISFQVLVWDPGIQVRFSSTLRQGRFEGEGMIRTLLLIPVLQATFLRAWILTRAPAFPASSPIAVT